MHGFYHLKGPEVRSGDLPQPVMLSSGQEFTFTIQRGVGTANCVSVNYDDFVNDVEVGDMLLVDGMLHCLFLFIGYFYMTAVTSISMESSPFCFQIFFFILLSICMLIPSVHFFPSL